MTRHRWIAAPLALALLSLPACLVWTTGGSKIVPLPMTQSGIDSARTEIITTMERSAQSWNRGDLTAFVSDYDSLQAPTFIGKNKVTRGRPAIREIYAPRFAPGGMRDSLSFENIEVDLLAPDAANVIAFYRLTRGDSTTSRGPTSLVMRKRGGGWKITHDHSS
jgi:uncharacterized protein (TIGR02246 family)